MRFSTLQKTFSRTFSKTMLKATRLTTSAKLVDATRLIQRTLAKTLPTPTQPEPGRKPLSPEANHASYPASATSRDFVLVPEKHADAAWATVTGQATSTGQASFTLHQFKFEGNTYPYRLYLPSMPEAAFGEVAKLPLVVLLHGCNQDALDFSHGTAMNRLAEVQRAMVLYPEQVASGNAMRCWNWFDPNHQQAGRGEPGMIAALVLKIVAEHQGDPDRTYVSGLSAGGAMAAVVANLYPQLFAAVGVHSGLAAGAAKNMMQALSAMKKGTKGTSVTTGSHTTAIPTIVFHGTADQTVNPSNGKFITQAALAAFESEGLTLVKSQTTAGTSKNERAERTLYSNADGKPFIESWRITAGPHAWSGGNAQGSYTDPDGPDASAAMLAFFLQHSKGEAAR